jgi:hypothetical protein
MKFLDLIPYQQVFGKFEKIFQKDLSISFKGDNIFIHFIGGFGYCNRQIGCVDVFDYYEFLC